MSDTIIELERVTKAYYDGTRTLEVLRDADLRVASGELVAVVGPSGSGKSTLLHVAGGLDRRYTGRVRVEGRDLASLPDEALSALRARRIGFVFQSFNLLPGFSALENVLLPGFFGGEAADATDRAEAALAEVGLAEKRHRRPGELSGGERQRVALARALYSRPGILLADEPTGNLDARTGAQVIELFQRLNEAHGVTLVVVTHEERVSSIADRVLRLTEGRLVEEAA
jgi:putative ABC transport system ATP-binding protein